MTDRGQIAADGGEWSDIEAFLSDVSQLSETPSSLGEFADATLHRTVKLLEAISGGIWLANHLGEIQPIAQSATLNAEDLLSNGSGDHVAFLAKTARLGRAARSPVANEDGDPLLRIAVPCRLDEQNVGIFEVLQPASIGEQALAGNEKLLAMVGQLTESFHHRCQQRESLRSDENYRQRETFFRRIHASLELGPTTYRIANESRHLIGCDRVSLLIPQGAHFRVAAISGIDLVDSKSDVVRSMRQLAEVVAKSGQWLQFRGDTQELPPQIQDCVVDFVDLADAQAADVVPLFITKEDEQQELVGILILERYRDSDDDSFEERVSSIATLCASALRNALEHDTLPLLAVSRSVRGVTQMTGTGKRRTLLAAATVMAFLAILAYVPMRFSVSCDGEAVALSQRHVFAPLDGEVVELNCGHDQPVRDGQILLRLRNRQLDIDLERAQGEYQTVEKKLLAINLARLESNREQAPERFPGQLAAEEQELKQRLDSLLAELQLLKKQQEQLTIRSPLSGRLMTWDPEGLLTDRPVQRGQRLLTVADLSGSWRVQVNIPVRNVGHVVESFRDSTQPLQVEFRLANGIGRTFRGELEEIARRIEVAGNDQLSMRAWVSVPSDAIASLRPGTQLHAKIDCGRRSIGYVWFHELIYTVKQWVFL